MAASEHYHQSVQDKNIRKTDLLPNVQFFLFQLLMFVYKQNWFMSQLYVYIYIYISIYIYIYVYIYIHIDR